jgi:Cdc6-like AAA superfamily ATPase
LAPHFEPSPPQNTAGRKPEKAPQDVFTPRAAQINESMYVPRPDLEKALSSALRGALNIIIHGESGTGKSWLYKRVFKDLNATVEIANLANASRFGTIKDEIRNLIERRGEAYKLGYSENKVAEIGVPGIAKGGASHTGNYSIGQKEPLEACFEHVRGMAGAGVACIVLDNLESIFSNQELMKELADIVILLDDDRYSRHQVKLLIVGVPSGVKEYCAKTPNMSTVANRLYEIPEVSRLTSDQASELIRRGFK